MIDNLTGFGPWGWLALGAILLAAELMTGTAYLLWLASAAAMTAALVALPGDLSLTSQLILFSVLALGTTAVGRRVFKPAAEPTDQPSLNAPQDRHIGARVIAVAPFENGLGRVRMGDTEWAAEALDGGPIAAGMALVVTRAEGAKLLVQPAD